MTRGVHRTLDEAPGPVCIDFDEVIDVVTNGKFEREKLDKFIVDSFDEHNKYASDLLIDNLILNYMEE